MGSTDSRTRNADLACWTASQGAGRSKNTGEYRELSLTLVGQHTSVFPPRRQEGKSSIVVTCVGGVYDRESILANIPVGQRDI